MESDSKYSDQPFDDPPERRRIRHATDNVVEVRAAIATTNRTLRVVGYTLGGVATLAAGLAEAWKVFGQLLSQH